MRPGVETGDDGRLRVAYPYGTVPRLLLSWLATETVRTQSSELILGESLADFMRQLGMGEATGGKTGSITRLRRHMNRLFDATISAICDVDPSRDIGHNFTIASMKSLWWTDDDRNADQPSLLPSIVRLSQEFFRELIEHPVPVDLHALRLLQKSPLALDIYAWLTHRNSYAQARSNIKWEQLQIQFGSSTATDGWRGRAKFREVFKKQLRYVLTVYPEARIEVEKEGVVVWPSRTHVAPTKQQVTTQPAKALPPPVPRGRRSNNPTEPMWSDDQITTDDRGNVTVTRSR